MTIERVLKPSDDQIIYHYCSNEAFLAICEAKSLRLSDVNMMNDYAEGRWGYRLFEQAANALLHQNIPGLNEKFFNKVDETISPLQLHLHPVCSSFSKVPDLLSQWRGYAEDGQGVAIGFFAKEIERLPITLLEVCYDKKIQLTEMQAVLRALFEVEKEEKNKLSKEFKTQCALIGLNSLAYKNPAFSEEQEIRCYHVLDVVPSGDFAKLHDNGGYSGKKKVKGSPVCFQVRNQLIVPFIDLKFPRVKGGNIAEVWLGPRNNNSKGNFLYPLHQNGFTRAQLRTSKATYC